MKCEIKSWGQQEIDCITGNCAQCDVAWNYMSLFDPGSFSSMLSFMTTERVGNDLVSTVVFNDGDPNIYKCTIVGGKYNHLQKLNNPPD